MGRVLTWCSYAGEERFNGIVILAGDFDVVSAALMNRLLGLSPGGQLYCMTLYEEDMPASVFEEYWHSAGRLLDQKEASRLADL